MEKYKGIIHILKEYRVIDTKIKDLQLKLKELEEYEEIGISAIDYSRDKIGKTYKFNSIVENQAIDIADQKVLLNAEIIHLQTLKQRIDNALQILDDEEKVIIKEKYMKNKKWYMVAMEVGSSVRRTIYRAEEALSKIEKILFEKG